MTKLEKNAKTKKIKQLYNELHHKTEFIKYVAEHFEREPRSVWNNWFGAVPQIPKDKMDKLIQMLEDTIKEQKKSA